MNLSDSKKKLALAGVVCGLVAACLAFLGNPANMAFCIACFIRDTAGGVWGGQGGGLQAYGGCIGNASGGGSTVCQAGNYRPGSGGIFDISGD